MRYYLLSLLPVQGLEFISVFHSYKQNKFNLLREQSEGFSKLVTEVTSALPAPHSPATGLPLEPQSIVPERVQPIWKRIVSLIGYFDLDPNRALDVILDLFSAYLTTHWSFFLVLLSLSPWKGQCASLAWINEEKTEPTAQVLGFKFRHYQVRRMPI